MFFSFPPFLSLVRTAESLCLGRWGKEWVLLVLSAEGDKDGRRSLLGWRPPKGDQDQRRSWDPLAARTLVLNSPDWDKQLAIDGLHLAFCMEWTLVKGCSNLCFPNRQEGLVSCFSPRFSVGYICGVLLLELSHFSLCIQPMRSNSWSRAPRGSLRRRTWTF